MKHIKFLLLLLFSVWMNTGLLRAQCTAANWGGITFASAEPSSGLHPNTIHVSWPASLTVERYTIQTQDITTSGDWTTVVSNLDNWYYYIPVNTAHNYNVAVTVTCPDGSTKTSVRYQVPGENFSQIGNCLGIWSGLTTYSTDGTSLTVRWTDAKVDHYEVWTKLVDFFANPPTEWELQSNSISSLSYTINGLEARESYDIKIVAVCRDGTRLERIHPFSIYIDGITTAHCDPPFGLSQIPSTTSAQLLSVMYTYLLGANIQYFVTYSEAASNVYTTVPWTFPGLNQPNGQAIALTITGLKPNTLYNWYIIMVCNGFGQNTGYTFSPSSKFFTKPLPPGACGCTQGNFTQPASANVAATRFYCGTITDAAQVTQSSAVLTLEASAVVLNPGFTSAISGNGAFKAISFNPGTCITTAKAGETAGEETIIKPENRNGLSVFPNPTTGLLNIQTSHFSEIVNAIVITDASGRTVFTAMGNNRKINISRLNSGLYFCKITTDRQAYTVKLVKQ